MDTALLRNLGVNEKIIQAIQKSYGDNLEDLEILQDKADLKLVLKRHQAPNNKAHVVTIHDFFEKKSFSQIAESEVEYHVEKYKCKDTIAFFPHALPGEPNVSINGDKLMLADALYKLLYHLGHEMKQTETGWVYIQDLQSNGIIHSDGYQPFSRLRSALGGYLLKKNPKDLIESNGRKQYRISINPKNISIPNGVLK